MGKKGFNRRRGGGGGGGARAAAQTEAEQYAELLELLRRHNESSEAERRRAKNRSRSVLALALALAQVILGMFLLAAEQLCRRGLECAAPWWASLILYFVRLFAFLPL